MGMRTRFAALMGGIALPAMLAPLTMSGVAALTEGEGGEGGGGGGGGDAGAAAAAAAAAGAANRDIPADAWYIAAADQAPAEGKLSNRQFMANKGFASIDDAVNAYRGLEEKMGSGRFNVPASAEDTAGWDAVFKALGRPEKAEDYKIGEILGVKDGEALPEFAGKFTELAHKIGLNPNQVKALADFNQAELAAGKELSEAQFAEKAATEITELKGGAGWGAKFGENMAIAKGAMQQFGFTKEKLETLEKGMGTRGMLEHLLDLGKRIGEDGFTGGAGNKLGGYTPEQAAQAKATIIADPAKSKALTNGTADPALKAEWAKINAAIAAGLDREVD